MGLSEFYGSSVSFIKIGGDSSRLAQRATVRNRLLTTVFEL